jgi:BASS family bile acid:Na+ symporter
MASNVLTLNAGGNTSYSVSLTTTATLLSPLAVPLVLWATLVSAGAINYGILIESSVMLLLTVVIPVVAGYAIGRLQSEATQRTLNMVGAMLANLAILIIIAVVVGRNRDRLQQVRLDIVWILLIVNLGGYAAGYLGALLLRIAPAMRRALTLEIGMQNAGLGATLALTLFKGHPEVAIAPAIYTFGCMLTGTLLASIWSVFPIASTASPANELTKPPGAQRNRQ